MLIVGLPVFWLEMYMLPSKNGDATALATFIFLLICMIVIANEQKTIILRLREFVSEFRSLKPSVRGWVLAGVMLTSAILLFAFYASLLPPHLSQEYDALNYHLTLPRQHLIRKSFGHIEWSSADLFLLPLDCALAPYWFVTDMPNKFPQFLFLIGLLLLSMKIMKRFTNNQFLSSVLIVFAICGSHGFTIQMGTAMLDLVISYLFLAFIDSLLSKNFFLAMIEFCFFFWAKPFIPFQIAAGIGFVIALHQILKRSRIIQKTMLVFHESRFDLLWMNFRNQGSRLTIYFVMLSALIAGPFFVKSLYYTGTPVYPFFTGLFDTRFAQDVPYWKSIHDAALVHMRSKTDYGSGRNLVAFIKHVWLLAVPDSRGTNNQFDYPLGLPYLLLVFPFFFLIADSFRKKCFPIMPVFAVVYWLSWWMGSQQTRFLYIPLLLIMISTLSFFQKVPKILIACFVLALFFSATSVFRAHRHSFFVPVNQFLGAREQALIEMNRNLTNLHSGEFVPLDYNEVAFARFPVTVTKEKLPFVITSRVMK